MARRTAPPAPVAAPLIEVHTPTHTAALLPLRCLSEEPGHNPRSDYGEMDGTFAALVDSIRRDGLLEPILVRQIPDRIDDWWIVAGHRRAAAAKAAGLDKVPCLWLTGNHNPVALALTENLQRRDLNPLEEAEGYQRLESLGWSQENIGRTVGRSQPHVSRALSLLGLPEGTRTMLREGLLSASHGAELVPALRAGLPAEEIDGLAGRAVEHDQGVHQLRYSVDRWIEDHKRKERAAQTAIPVDDEEPAREYATSHKSPTAAATAPDALTRPAAAPEVKPGYTQADAKAEYEASQQPDPDETTPVQDAIRAARERGQEESAGWESTGRMTNAERVAWLQEVGIGVDEAFDLLRARIERDEQEEDAGWSVLPPRTYEISEEDHASLIAAGYESEEAGRVLIAEVIDDAIAHRGRDVKFTMEFSAEEIADIERLMETGVICGWGSDWRDAVGEGLAEIEEGKLIGRESWELLGKIAGHYGRSPQDQLLATLGARWRDIEDKQAQKGEVG